MTPLLYIGNRNYSSWSMRAWLAMTWAGLEFDVKVIPLGGPGYAKRAMPEILTISPAGTVPALDLDGDVIADSLAISEWAAEQVHSLWPADARARAHARAATCEMHSGFGAVRDSLSCNLKRRTPSRPLPEDATREIARIEDLWESLREDFGGDGPYLFGAKPTIADAFFTPIATRFRTYSVPLNDASQRYVDALLADPAFREWERAALEETWTIPQIDAS